MLLSLTILGLPRGGDSSDGVNWLSSISCFMIIEVSKFCVVAGSFCCVDVRLIFLLLLRGMLLGM